MINYLLSALAWVIVGIMAVVVFILKDIFHISEGTSLPIIKTLLIFLLFGGFILITYMLRRIFPIIMSFIYKFIGMFIDHFGK